MLDKTNVKTLDKVVVRFSGDSGDGMQLAGNIFTNVSAGLGNKVSTFPDYPAEVRAPQGSLSGVSGFQVSVGVDVHTPGDLCDVLIAMNPAALKQNIKFLKAGGVVIVDIDSFKESDLKKALFETLDPFKELDIKAQVVEVPVTSMTKAALAESGLDNKSILKCRNIFALGLVCWLFDRPLEGALRMLKGKFAKKPAIYEANAKVIEAGYNYGNNIHASVSTYRIETEEAVPGVYTDINGNTATAWGFIMASEKCGRTLFLRSYPITPATDLLHALAKRQHRFCATLVSHQVMVNVICILVLALDSCDPIERHYLFLFSIISQRTSKSALRSLISSSEMSPGHFAQASRLERISSVSSLASS